MGVTYIGTEEERREAENRDMEESGIPEGMQSSVNLVHNVRWAMQCAEARKKKEGKSELADESEK